MKNIGWPGFLTKFVAYLYNTLKNRFDMKRYSTFCLLGIFILFVVSASYAASVNNGGGQKKQSTANSTLLGKNFKSYFPLSFASGYRLKGSLHFTTTQHQSMIMHHNVMRFEKGNTLYVLPYRQKQAHAKIKIGVHP